MPSARIERAALIVLIVLSLVLLALVIYPFASALLVAAVLAGALRPWTERLAARLGRRRQLAAGIVTLGVLLLLVIPIATVALSLANEVVAGVGYVRQTLRSEGVTGLIDDLPAPLRGLAEKLLEQIPGGEAGIQDLSDTQRGRAAAVVGGVLGATTRAIVHVVMMLIALFFLLIDGRALVDWLVDIAPMQRNDARELMAEFRKVSVTVLTSTLATAAIQAAVALVGYLIAGVPQWMFFTFVTFVMAFVPAVGAGGAGLAAAALVFFSGHTYRALFLAVWALVAVGLSDNIVKPYLIRGGVAIHGAVVFFALLGGLSVFGPIGLLLGPLVVAFFLSVIRIVRREYPQDPRAEGDAERPLSAPAATRRRS
jgi:predicted PurR-regulated permease PerM